MFCSRERSESVERVCRLLPFCSSSSNRPSRQNRHNRDRDSSSSSRRLCRSLCRREQSRLSLHFRGREVPPARGGTREESNVLEEEPAIVEERVAADVAPQQSRVPVGQSTQHTAHSYSSTLSRLATPSIRLFTSTEIVI